MDFDAYWSPTEDFYVIKDRDTTILLELLVCYDEGLLGDIVAKGFEEGLQIPDEEGIVFFRMGGYEDFG